MHCRHRSHLRQTQPGLLQQKLRLFLLLHGRKRFHRHLLQRFGRLSDFAAGFQDVGQLHREACPLHLDVNFAFGDSAQRAQQLHALLLGDVGRGADGAAVGAVDVQELHHLLHHGGDGLLQLRAALGDDEDVGVEGREVFAVPQ